ncbi:uncharacterized protein RCC_01803 [Ramularia collo-cygni]|uniref:Uncharacterized protein n=1 Tax=Ramularia collo-cygni TaxID=112498 RepID=A0A2D3V6L7_9PEZI|nr:uncharacterized protein RCC_01803 [Ramularia collo-cygni]CZT15963.1 uncharacterized protein RCC_01803 [Ramularia collo-cygni]
MKPSQISSLALLFAPAAMAASYLSKRGSGSVAEVPNPNVAPSVPDEAQTMFKDDSAPNLLFAPTNPPEDPSTIPDNIFVVQCLEQGFRGECMVLGGPPGQCVSYFDFDSETTSISDKFDKLAMSLSTNTGGVCQFYHEEGCNINGDDPGVTLSYVYDLSKSESGNSRPDDYQGDYFQNITSWRC